MNIRKLLILFVLLLAAFSGLSFFIDFSPHFYLDQSISRAVVQTRTGTATRIMKDITIAGSHWFLISAYLLLILFLLLVRKTREAWWIAVLALSGTAVMFLLKQIVERPRPDILHITNSTGYSFPSGHSFSSLLFFSICGYIIYQSNMKNNAKISMIIILLLIPVLVGYSRIYLGVHYITDVLGGFLLSIIFLVGVFILMLVSEKEKKKQN